MDFAGSQSQPILIVVLTLVQRLFRLGEMAIVSRINKMRLLADGGNAAAALVLKLWRNPRSSSSTIQVGITWPACPAPLPPPIFGEPWQAPWLHRRSLWGADRPGGRHHSLSYITLVFGELFPKRIACKRPRSVALSVRPILARRSRCLFASSSPVHRVSLKLTGMAGDELKGLEVRAMVKAASSPA